MKKIVVLVVFLSLFAYAQSSLDTAASSFDIEGGAEQNTVLYKMAGDDESGKNEKAFLKKRYLQTKKTI